MESWPSDVITLSHLETKLMVYEVLRRNSTLHGNSYNMYPDSCFRKELVNVLQFFLISERH